MKLKIRQHYSTVTEIRSLRVWLEEGLGRDRRELSGVKGNALILDLGGVIDLCLLLYVNYASIKK